jgi:hypothetical protein
MFFTPRRPNTLNIPIVNPYLSVSNKEAIGGGCGFGPQIASITSIAPQSVVKPNAHPKIRLNRSFMAPSAKETIGPAWLLGWCGSNA